MRKPDVLTTNARNKKARGEVYNHAPYGYRAKDGLLTADATEQAVVARMTALRAARISYNEIANTLNADNVPTKYGSNMSERRLYHRG